MKVIIEIDISNMNLAFARIVTGLVMPYINKIRLKDKSEGNKENSSFQRGVSVFLQEFGKRYGVKIESTSGLRSLIGKAGSIVKISRKKK